jgi:Spy/CpxP family protein refolding chaperone
MRKFVVIAPIAIFGYAAGSVAQEAPSPYRGQEGREIKSLSSEEIRSLEAGEGMGFAKAAELNRYPGPKHVLDLAEALELSEEQRIQTQEAFDRMHKKAVALGSAIVEEERGLDRLFRDREIDQKKLEAAVREIARLQGKLRLAHLEAHLEMRSLLTQEQIDRYVELRGYHDSSRHDQHDQESETHEPPGV